MSIFSRLKNAVLYEYREDKETRQFLQQHSRALMLEGYRLKKSLYCEIERLERTDWTIKTQLLRSLLDDYTQLIETGNIK